MAVSQELGLQHGQVQGLVDFYEKWTAATDGGNEQQLARAREVFLTDEAPRLGLTSEQAQQLVAWHDGAATVAATVAH